MSRCDECMVIGSRECCKCARELERDHARLRCDHGDLGRAYDALRERHPTGRKRDAVTSYDRADWPYPREWEVEDMLLRERAEEAEANLAAVMGVLEKECPEQAPVSPLGFPRHPKQTLLCNACGEARNENRPDALEWHKPDCSWRITREAIANMPPAAVRLRAIVRAAEAETDIEDEWEVSATHSETCAFRAKLERAFDARRKAVRGEGE